MIQKTLAILFMLLAAACATTATDQLPSITSVQYLVGPGDDLKIEIFGEDRLSGQYQVGDQGTFTMPLVGEVQARGRTVQKLREELTELLGSEYVRNPDVTLEIANFRSVYILGEVQRPGEYPYKEKMSVHALVAMAGGFSYRANEGIVYVRHEDEADERVYVLQSGSAVMPGDVIRIGARYY